MDFLFYFILFCAGLIITGIVFWLNVFGPQRLQSIFNDISRILSLDPSQKRFFIRGSEFYQEIGGFPFEILPFSSGKSGKKLKLYVKHQFKHLGSFSIRAMDTQETIGIPLDYNDILTGDKIFDNHFFLLAEKQQQLVGKLDSDCRKNLMELSKHAQVEIFSNKVLSLNINEYPYDTLKDRLVFIIRKSLAVIKRFNIRQLPDLEMKTNCSDDPLPEVRANNLRELFYQRKTFYNMEAILNRCLEDRDWIVKLAAAELAGEKAFPLIIKALFSDETKTNHLAVEIIGKCNYHIPAEYIACHLKTLKNQLSITLMAPLLAHWNNPDTTALLALWLEMDDQHTKIACLKALSICGTRNELNAVYQSAAGEKTLSVIKEEARKTIDAILSRNPESDRGMLSIEKEISGGGLSEISHNQGSLDMTSKENG